jgi:hypothetical protein
MIRLLVLQIVLLGLVAFAVNAQEVYRWVDEDGIVHFSDRPVEGEENAEAVELSKAQTFTSPAAPTPKKKTDSAAGAGAPADAYREIAIVKPGPAEVIWNTAGEIEVAVQVVPGLKKKHSILLFIDDRMVDGKADGDLKFKLTEVERGTHALHAEVQDATGTALVKSAPVTFTVQQQSILNQNNPKNIPGPGIPGPTG